MEHIEHSNWICFVIGLIWALSGAFGILSFFSYDQNRMTEHAVKLYNRFIASIFLFGLSTVIFIIHAIIHP